MSDKNLTLTSSHLLHRQANDSGLISSTKPLTPVRRRFSAAKMLNKAKDSTISLVKRHSLESKRSADENLAVRPGLEEDKRSSSLTSLEQLKVPSSNESLPNDDSNISKILSTRKKHYSLPIKRPFTIKKDSADSSLSSFTTTSSNNTTAPATATESSAAAAAAAEADILSGTERPGSFATACDFRLAKDKRNEEFHALFKSVRENDLLIQGIKKIKFGLYFGIKKMKSLL